MMVFRSVWVWLGLAFLLTGAASASAAERFAVDSVDLMTRKGQFGIRVEMAVTWAQRAQGLQHRKYLAPDNGMLFDYGRSQSVTMWMKNTYIPLDMLFIGADGRIVKIAKNTKPLSLDRIPSEWPVRAVLELQAGSADRMGVLPGDRVLHSLFK